MTTSPFLDIWVRQKPDAPLSNQSQCYKPVSYSPEHLLKWAKLPGHFHASRPRSFHPHRFQTEVQIHY